MKHIILIISLITIVHFAGCSQQPDKTINSKGTTPTGELCEGCEAVYESPVPFNKLLWIDTLPDYNLAGPKLNIEGIVYNKDGKTPAKNVVIYIYHTDQTGRYSTKGNETGWGKRHGNLRGWVKTDDEGKYAFFTLRPASYPGANSPPAHIHTIIKEPGKNPYWIDDFLFDDDPALTKTERSRQRNYGGDGILKPELKNGLWSAKRDIILGLNMPGYSTSASIKKMQSGLPVGSSCPAFGPLHFSGADAGKEACPMCKYGYGQGIMVWFNHTNLDTLKQFVQTLENKMIQVGEKKLRIFVIYMNEANNLNNKTQQKINKDKIKEWCIRQNLKKVALVLISDKESCNNYKINPAADNTVFLYKKRLVAAKWVNIDYSNQALTEIFRQL